MPGCRQGEPREYMRLSVDASSSSKILTNNHTDELLRRQEGRVQEFFLSHFFVGHKWQGLGGQGGKDWVGFCSGGLCEKRHEVAQYWMQSAPQWTLCRIRMSPSVKLIEPL